MYDARVDDCDGDDDQENKGEITVFGHQKLCFAAHFETNKEISTSNSKTTKR